MLKLINGLVIESKFKSSIGHSGVRLYKSEFLSVSNEFLLREDSGYKQRFLKR